MSYRTRNITRTPEEIPVMIVGIPAEEFFDLCIRALVACEDVKIWVKNPGVYIDTCGYSGPGIGLMIFILESQGINNGAALRAYVNSLIFNQQKFCNVINEVIGNLLDLSAYCPITNVDGGICGLIRQDQTSMVVEDPGIAEIVNADELPVRNVFGQYVTPKKFSVSAKPRFNIQRNGRVIGPAPRVGPDPVFPANKRKVHKVLGSRSLRPGVNILSFSDEEHGFVTFHHATIYTIPDINVCYIIDSWMATCPITGDPQFRKLSVRRFTYEEVINCIEEIHLPTTTIERRYKLMEDYFLAHPSLLDVMRTSPFITIFTLDRDYLEYIYKVAFIQEEDRPGTTAFGRRSKRNKNIKRRSSSKKTNKRRKHSQSRRTKRTKRKTTK